jgi:hypothetical protein
MPPRPALVAVKTFHTVAWAFFAGCILAIPYFAWKHEFVAVFVASACVLVEIAILLVNAMKCPLTAVAARYTTDRRANFDIYLPEWIARYNKEIFGTLLVAGWMFAVFEWWSS